MSKLEVRIVAHHRYPSSPGWDIEQVKHGADHLARALRRVSPITPVDDSARATSHHHQEWLRELAQPPTGPMVVYWAGHAEMLGDVYGAAFPDSGPDLTRLESLTADRLEALIETRQAMPPSAEEEDWLVLILDTCQSVAGAEQIWRSLAGKRRNTAIVATSNETGSAFAGRFPTLFSEYLDSYGQNDDQIDLLELLRRIGDALDEEQNTSGGAHLHTSIRSNSAVWPRRAAGSLVGIRADMQELRSVLVGVPDVVRHHFYSKASGMGLNQFDWHFTGRYLERNRIAEWLRQENRNGLCAVTGSAGSGKSALLGMILASTSPELVTALQNIGVPFPAETRPRDTRFTTTLHLNNRGLDEIVREIAEQEGFTAIGTTDDLVAAFRDADTPRLILADALDESSDALPLALLLHRIASQPGCRVVVGTRRSLDENPDHPIPLNHDLTDALRPDETITIEASRSSFREYAARRLARRLDGWSAERITEVAEGLAQAAPSFLYMRLAIEEVSADPIWSAPGVSLDALPRTHQGLFERAVARLRSFEPKTEHLLHALAYARGNGFPRTARVWETAGSAIAGTTLADPDVRRALETASPFIVQDAEFGCEVYRLGHRTFVEYYLALDRK